MPSLIRFLVVVGVLVGIAYGAFYALAVVFEPEQSEVRKPVLGVQIK